MKRTNYHTHTYLCKHAQGTPSDYAKNGFTSGLNVLGFSDHGPFPDANFGLRMEYKELDLYIDSVNSSKKKYSEKMDIYNALEIEYLPDYDQYYQFLLKEKKLDYLNLGQHFFKDSDGEIKNIFFLAKDGKTEAFPSYAKSIVTAMEKGYFSFVAHPDIFAFGDYKWDENCEKASELIIDGAKNTGTLLEFNANGIRRGKEVFDGESRYPYPFKKFWDKVSKTDIKVLVNSDCHNPDQVYDKYVTEAHSIALEWGLNLTDSLGTLKK